MSPRRKRFLIAAALSAVTAAAAVAALPGESEEALGADPSDRALVALGADVYARECASCHGVNLEGQANWRVRRADGRLPAPPHDETGHTWHHPDQLLFAITKYGPEKFAQPGYKSDMPGFGDRLSDREIWAALAYIKSRWPEEIRRRHRQMQQARR